MRMSLITVRPASGETWNDVQAALTGGGDGKACQCQWVVMRNPQVATSPPVERREFLHREVASDTPPGLVAYVDGQPAGWVRVGPRTAHPRIVHSRVATPSPEPMDDPDVWVVSCFSARNEHRRKGVTAVLLDAAVAYARESGARVVEAYPVDNIDKKMSANSLFVGTLSTFLDAGFRIIAEPTPARRLVSLTL